MRSMGPVLTLALLGLLLPAPQGVAAQASFPDRPPAGTFYVDEAGLIDAEKGRAINEIAAAQMELRRVPILVVTISSLASRGAAGYTIEEYAAALFDAWGIGSKDNNYGMLLLVSRDDRRARIELGRSWNHTRDADARRVMDELIVPEFKRSRFAAGVLAGVRGMNAMASGGALPKRAAPWWFVPAIVATFGFGLALAVSLWKSGQKGWAWAVLAALFGLLFLLLRARTRQRAATSRERGPGIFARGSSGGGGATGSW